MFYGGDSITIIERWDLKGALVHSAPTYYRRKYGHHLSNKVLQIPNLN